MTITLANTARTSPTLADTLLQQIAERVQLSATDYGIAVDHYEAVNDWLARPGAPLASVFTGLYPQGSMAIGATIASRLNNDEFDIDVIAELDIEPTTAPALVLDRLFDAMNGVSGSRYHGKVVRRSRCVTVEYDRMHLDITPAVRLFDREDRTSVIFHANETEAAEHHRHIVANPWGFAQWFQDETPQVREIVEAVLRKSADPVPDQQDVMDKSLALISLQLLKRWRNKCYDNREGRSPPSVVLAYFVALNAGGGHDLFSELRNQAAALYDVFAQAEREPKLVGVINPRCETDVLTDRWPGDRAHQQVFLRDLIALNTALDEVENDPTVETCSKVFGLLFGENVTRVVVEDFQKQFSERARAGGLFSGGGTAGLALGASGLGRVAPAVIRAPTVAPIPRHTDFGGED